MSPELICIFIGIAMIAIERFLPRRALPKVAYWRSRVVVLDLLQIALVLGIGATVEPYVSGLQFGALGAELGTAAGALLGYLAITFVYYWWHRWRHEVPVLWRTLHQLHHSPQRIEVITSFYKHPFEIATNALISMGLLFVLLGLNAEQAAWAVVIATVAELFYHWNVKTPHWLGWFIQRPEMHGLHHERGKHAFNYGDLPIWDMLFGTYRNPETWDAPCGFGDDELRLWSMFTGVDVAMDQVASDAHPTTMAQLRSFGQAFTPNRRALALVGLGALSIVGDLTRIPELTGLGVATGAAPYPKVFTSRDGLEGFSSSFYVTWTENGEDHTQQLTPDLYSGLEGPYNRRNPYGAALAGGPFLASQAHTAPMLDAVSQWAFCNPDGVLSELGITDDATDVRIRVQQLPGAQPTSLPLNLDVSCS